MTAPHVAEGGADDVDWLTLISNGRPHDRAAVQADDFVESLPSASKPQKFRCGVGQLYAVKFHNNPYGDGRAIFTEQLVGQLGRRIGASVAEVRYVLVPEEILDELQLHLDGVRAAPGIQHGSKWASGYSDRKAIAEAAALNHQPLGALSVLYTWLHAGDHQLICQDNAPHNVLSVDHSAFIVDGGGWTEETLSTIPEPTAFDPQFDPYVVDVDRVDALEQLQRVTPADIAAVVASPPDEWGVTMAERVALADFVHRRQRQVLTLGGMMPQ